MRRWIIACSVLLILAAAVYAERWARPDEDPRIDCETGVVDLRTKIPLFSFDTAFCTAPLSHQAAINWWQKMRKQREASGGSDCAKTEDWTDSKSGPSQCQKRALGILNERWVDWTGANLSGMKLRGRDKGAYVAYSNLSGARFVGVDAPYLTLEGSLLMGARFERGAARVAGGPPPGGDISGADFTWADLRSASFDLVNIKGATFRGANLDRVKWDPLPGALPDVSSFASAINLERMQYDKSPLALSELRDAFYKAGMTRQGQQITYAIERTRRIQDGWSYNPLDVLSSWGRLVAFELPVGYGMNMFRPLVLVVLLIPFFAPFYVWAIHREKLWIRRPDGAVGQRTFKGWIPVRHLLRGSELRRIWSQIKVALWFSTVCAFRVGYRDVNVGDWITRLQSKEFLLAAKGGYRTVSGLQSLISVYLLALTVLCVIGRPFG